MKKKKILIFKNDRTGDLFVSLNTINKIINKNINHEISIFLSDINHKFSFLFPDLKKKIFSINLSILEKLRIFFYLFLNNIDEVYILTPKNFYYYLPFFFKKIKFYGITIKAKKGRPNNFLRNYLYKTVEIDRININKRKSSYIIQEELISTESNINYLKKDSVTTHNFKYPNKFIIFHYKRNLFEKLLNWDLKKIIKFIEFLASKHQYILFSSEFKDTSINNYFLKQFNTYDYDASEEYIINDKNIIFLKNIDGYDLFDVISKSNKIIAPEGIITHIGYFLKKPILALLHFNLRNREDFINQIISCKEWFPPNNYNYSVLKKDFDQTLKKLNKRV